MNKKVWMITDAGNDHAAKVVRAARAAGDAVLATGRDVLKLEALFGEDTDDFHIFQMDVISEAQTNLAARNAYARFGRIDVLVSGETIQSATKANMVSELDNARSHQMNVAGGLNLLRAALPYMQGKSAIFICLSQALIDSYKARHSEIEFITDTERLGSMFPRETQELL